MQEGLNIISGAQFAVLPLVMSGLNLCTLLYFVVTFSSANNLPSGFHYLYTRQLVPCVSEIYTLIVVAQGLTMFLMNFLLCYRTAQGHGSSYKGSLIWLPSNSLVYS